MRVKRIVFVNRAPFNHLDLVFEDANVISLTGINGAGKTTIISYIVDAFYEMARKAYNQEFSGEKEGKLYRVSTDLNNIQGSHSSLVYICFSHSGKKIHYCDFQGIINETSFKELMNIVGEDTDQFISFSNISNQLGQGQRYAKYVSVNDNECYSLFENNIATYFPSYRYEEPGYLNDVYRMRLAFKNTANFNGYLPNPVEVTSDLPEIANWVMDVILDRQLYPLNKDFQQLHDQLNTLVASILSFKIDVKTRLGIGERHLGGARIQITNQAGGMIYPTIFNMSAGESGLFCLFAELIKQADRLKKKVNDIEGIVLIDEIDKHLHISMQMNSVPILMQMFPNIQFIFSTHSTFVNIGLEEKFKEKCTIFDISSGGVECRADENGVFREAYETMIRENERYAQQYKRLQESIESETKPIIITEGKSDWKHIKTAQKRLGFENLDIRFYEYNDTIGDDALLKMIKDYSRISHGKTIIGIFDRDNFDKLKEERLRTQKYIDFGNDVYAFAIPAVHSDVYGTDEISIEHYYLKDDLTKEDENHRRIFLGEEFYDSGISKDSKFLCRDSVHKKTRVNGIIDEKVYSIQDDPNTEHSLALSKNTFAELVAEGVFSKEFDFSSFEKIFEILKEICERSENQNTLHVLAEAQDSNAYMGMN